VFTCTCTRDEFFPHGLPAPLLSSRSQRWRYVDLAKAAMCCDLLQRIDGFKATCGFVTSVSWLNHVPLEKHLLFPAISSVSASLLCCLMLKDCLRMADFVHTTACTVESPPNCSVEIPSHLSSPVPAPVLERPASPPYCTPHALSLAVRHFNRDEPMRIFANWLVSFDAPQFPRERLFECCRDFLSTTLPSWTIACAPDAALSKPPLVLSRLRCDPPLKSHGFSFASSCVPSDCAGPSSILPFHRCCAFEWKDDAAWSFECSALARDPAQQSATWILACTSSSAVHSFVITGRVSLGSLSCFRADSHRSSSPGHSAMQMTFARYILVAVPHSGGGPSDCNKKWLSDFKGTTQLECLRSGYPNHDLSVPLASPFMFQQQRRFGMGQPRLFSSSFGQGPSKRVNYGSPR
jgi:hypothetical protein